MQQLGLQAEHQNGEELKQEDKLRVNKEEEEEGHHNEERNAIEPSLKHHEEWNLEQNQQEEDEIQDENNAEQQQDNQDILEAKQQQEMSTARSASTEQVRGSSPANDEPPVVLINGVPIRHLDHSISFRTFNPPEIQQHNEEVGWVEWIPHKGKVYDGNQVKRRFEQYVQERSQMEQDNDKPLNTWANLTNLPHITSPDIWKHNAVQVFRRNGVSEEEIEKRIDSYLIGYIRGTVGSDYWDSIREDVSGLVAELSQTEGERATAGVAEYFEMLKRWQRKYKNENPPHEQYLTSGVDRNQLPFPAPEDPDNLRPWLLTWQPFDLDVPETGAWEFLPGDVVHNEVMTPEQEAIDKTRKGRKEFTDTGRMQKRREELCQYFIQTRKIRPDVLTDFEGWAELMEKNSAELQALC
nr:hypothetical protein BaRGS_010405 [Batillaria attramentaria]